MKPTATSPSGQGVPLAGAAVHKKDQEKVYTPFGAFLQKFLKQRLAVTAGIVILLIVLVAVFAPLLTPYDPSRPVTDQYAERGIDVSSLGAWKAKVLGRMSDGTTVKEIPQLTAESGKREVARPQAEAGGIMVQAVTRGDTAIVIRSGQVSAVVEVGVSTEERAPVLSQLTPAGPAAPLEVGGTAKLALSGVLTDGSRLADTAAVEGWAADAFGKGEAEKPADNGFVTADTAKAAPGVAYASLTPQVVSVAPDGTVSALREGAGTVKVTVGDVSSLVTVPVGAAASAEPMLAGLGLPQTYAQLEDLHKHQPPSERHWFGTDHANRDIFSRIIAGTTQTLIIGFVSVFIGAALGVLFGLLSGYYGGRLDTLITRGADILLSFPGMLLAIFVIAVLGPGTVNVILAVATFTVPIFTRIVRGSVLSLKQMTYVEAARSIGVKNSVIIRRHIFPGTVSVIMIYLTMRVGSAILIGAGLSYLGLGADVTAPEWGAMLNAAKNNSQGLFFPILFPGLAILVTVLCFNILGDGLRDALDPKLKD
ncbi:ABC transporter permease subunit [Paenibacillus gansuensis]|uniref:Glutathione transport system permease protein GsiD n=1 Tax=Paenibacillus gansuensis TaxID=306542 RepID=A0ABW5PHJ5_9BACL